MGPDGEHGTENGAYIQGLGWVYIYLQSHLLIPKPAPTVSCDLAPHGYAGAFPRILLLFKTSRRFRRARRCRPARCAGLRPTSRPTYHLSNPCYPPYICSRQHENRFDLSTPTSPVLHAPADLWPIQCMTTDTHASKSQYTYTHQHQHPRKAAGQVYVCMDQPPQPTTPLLRHTMPCHESGEKQSKKPTSSHTRLVTPFCCRRRRCCCCGCCCAVPAPHPHPHPLAPPRWQHSVFSGAGWASAPRLASLILAWLGFRARPFPFLSGVDTDPAASWLGSGVVWAGVGWVLCCVVLTPFARGRLFILGSSRGMRVGWPGMIGHGRAGHARFLLRLAIYFGYVEAAGC